MPGVKMQAPAKQEKHAAGLRVSSKSRKGWAKGKMEGKGGPLNPACPYRGVRQRQWGMWVAEIREPGKKKRLWLGTYHTADEAALIYDRASRQFYGMEGYQNLRDFPGKHDADLKVPKSNSERQQQQCIARRAVDERLVAPSSSSSSSRIMSGGGSGSGRVSSTSASAHHLRPIRPDCYGSSNFPLAQSQSGGADRMVVDNFDNGTPHVARFNAASMMAAAANTPASPGVYLTEDALWRMQMEPGMKVEREDELPLEDCWSDCSASVTSAQSPDSREVGSSCLTGEEEPAWDNFPEILSLPNDLLLDEKELIYFDPLM